MTAADPRAEQLAAALTAVRGRITAACAASDRPADDVTLIVVTKTWPAADVGRLAALGVRDMGENRDQEASAKVAECLAAGVTGLTWHFVGQIQRNKVGSIARYADVVHSLDRPAVVRALSLGAQRAGRELAALVQVNLEPGADTGRGGAAPAEVVDLCGQVAAAPGLSLAGLMAVAPLGADPAAAFARLAGVRADVLREFPDARWLSAGMSGDLEAAIAAGATHVRVGTAVLGGRAHVG